MLSYAYVPFTKILELKDSKDKMKFLSSNKLFIEPSKSEDHLCSAISRVKK